MSFLDSTSRPFVLAEIANAHEGSFEKAMSMAKSLDGSDVDGIKFQCFTPDELAAPSFNYYGLYQQLSFSQGEWTQLAQAILGQGMVPACDVFGLDSLNTALHAGFGLFKLHASDLENHPLRMAVIRSGKPFLISAAGLPNQEVLLLEQELRDQGATDFVLMLGFQGYPTALEDTGLARLRALAAQAQGPLGFAGHLSGKSEDAATLPLLAASAGAALLEIHLVDDRSREGIDHYSALEPSEMRSAAAALKRLHAAQGEPHKLNASERKYAVAHRKQVVAARDLEAGALITERDLELRRTNEADPSILRSITGLGGRRLLRAVPQFEPLKTTDLAMKIVSVVPCRSEGTRLYGKPLQLIGKRSILEWHILQLQQAKRVDEVVLAIAETPSMGVFISFAKEKGLPYIIGDEHDVQKRLILGGQSRGADIITRSTPDNPFICWEYLDSIIEQHIQAGCDLSSLWDIPHGAIIEVITLSSLEKAHRLGDRRTRSEFSTIYMRENPELFDVRIWPHEDDIDWARLNITVDSPQELAFAREIAAALKLEDAPPSLKEIVALVKKDQRLFAMNQANCEARGL